MGALSLAAAHGAAPCAGLNSGPLQLPAPAIS